MTFSSSLSRNPTAFIPPKLSAIKGCLKVPPPAKAICLAIMDGKDSFCPSMYNAPSLYPLVKEFPIETNLVKFASPFETTILLTSVSKSVLQLTVNNNAETAIVEINIFFIIIFKS